MNVHHSFPFRLKWFSKALWVHFHLFKSIGWEFPRVFIFFLQCAFSHFSPHLPFECNTAPSPLVQGTLLLSIFRDPLQALLSPQLGLTAAYVRSGKLVVFQKLMVHAFSPMVRPGCQKNYIMGFKLRVGYRGRSHPKVKPIQSEREKDATQGLTGWLTPPALGRAGWFHRGKSCKSLVLSLLKYNSDTELIVRCQ